MLKQRFPKIHLFEPFFWVYYIWYYLPIVRTIFKSGIYNQIFFALFVTGCALCITESFIKRKTIRMEYNPLLPVLLYFAVFLIMVMFDVGTASRHIRISFSFWGTLIVYYLMNAYPSSQKRLTVLMLGMFLITMITSLVGVIVNPHAARTLAYSGNDLEEDLIIRMLNIGGIAFFQGLVICVPILLTFIYQRRFRVLSITLLVIIFISLLSASFTISLAMFFVALILGFVYNNSSLKKIGFILAIVIVVLCIPWADLLSYLSTIIDNDTISSRLTSIVTSISSGTASGNMGSRLQVYTVSLNTFLEHPLGVGPEYAYVTFQNGIGYHSQFLDDLARYGIFALTFYIMFLIGYVKLLRKQWAKINMRQIAIPVALVYFVFLIFNPGFTSEHEGVLILFLIPAFPSLFVKNKSTNDLHE